MTSDVSEFTRKIYLKSFSKIGSYIEIFRIKHYVKNLVILIPAVIYNDGHITLDLFLGVLAFCMLTSAVYCFNDIKDVSSDLAHPVKKNRPLPSERLSEKEVNIAIAILLATSYSMSALFTPQVIIFFIIYMAINVFYSLIAKEIPILDVLLVSSGFTIRLLVGIGIIGAPNEAFWLAVPITIASLTMAVGKRLAKLNSIGETDDVRIPSAYKRDALLGMTLLLSHLSVAIIAFILLVKIDDVYRFKVIVAILFTGMTLLITRVSYLMIHKNIEPAVILTEDRLSLAMCFGVSAITITQLAKVWV